MSQAPHRSDGVSAQAVPAASRRVWFLVSIFALLYSLQFATAQKPADLDARWRKLGVLRDELPPEKNPVVDLLKLLKEFPEDLRKEFSDGSQARPFNRYKPSAHTITQCARIQTAVRKIIARGPGQVPDQNKAWLPSDTFLLWRVNSVLATDAFDRGLHATAAIHLAFNFEIADFIFRSEPALMGFVQTTAIRKRVYEDLFALIIADPTKARLDQAAALHRRFRFKRSYLTAALRGEARFSRQLIVDLPTGILSSFESNDGKPVARPYENMPEPLRSCTKEDILAMKFDLNATLATFLQELEQVAKWIQSGEPCATHPYFTSQKQKPRSLDYYKTAPNGLDEIFRDCRLNDSFPVATVTTLAHDTFMGVALAWLRAEADGLEVNSLAELVPEYLKDLPLDPADGKPLRCLPDQRILYSIGPDLVDNGGAPSLRLSIDGTRPKFPRLTDETFLIPKLRP